MSGGWTWSSSATRRLREVTAPWNITEMHNDPQAADAGHCSWMFLRRVVGSSEDPTRVLPGNNRRMKHQIFGARNKRLRVSRADAGRSFLPRCFFVVVFFAELHRLKIQILPTNNRQIQIVVFRREEINDRECRPEDATPKDWFHQPCTKISGTGDRGSRRWRASRCLLLAPKNPFDIFRRIWHGGDRRQWHVKMPNN